ncbi:MAG: 3'-5' exoribonuclease [Bacteroidales bacterium]|nr:3'-5' exoribonuclease [Bacteroidales bacterium]
MENNFIAIDVETAQGKRWSICQIGLAIVENGKIVKTVSQLVQPPNNDYSPFNIRIHKITPEMTVNSLYFPEVWKEIYPLIENKKLVAHNASFDISCLNQVLGFYNIEKPSFDYDCTYKLSGQKLKEACKSLNIDLKNHHDACCDAEACANIYLKLSEQECSYINPKLNSKKTSRTNKTKKVVPSNKNTNDINFKNNIFCFTGKLSELNRSQAEKEVRSRTGLTQKTINNQLDYLIIGSIPSSGWKHGNYGLKIEKALELSNKNSKLKIISEEDFMIALENSTECDKGEIDQKFVSFRYEALLENGDFDIDSLEKFLIDFNESSNSHITAKFEDPNILQALYGRFKGEDVENSILFRCRIVKQFPLNKNIQEFINSIVSKLEEIDGVKGNFIYSEKKEGTASYAKLFQEIPSNIKLTP